MTKIEISTNESDKYSILVNRSIELKINDIKVKVLVEIFIFQDDDGNFKLEPSISETTYLINNKGKKITNNNQICEFFKTFGKENNSDLNKLMENHIIKHYKKYKNQQIKDLAKEYNITL